MRKLLLFLFALPAFATTYYVDNSCVSFNGNGQATNCAASGGASGAFNSIANIAGGAYAAGNTINLKCGQTYRETMTVGGSGSSGSPITIDRFGTCTGANNPIIKGSNAFLASAWTQTTCNGSTHCYFATYAHTLTGSQGFVFRNGNLLAWQSGGTSALLDQQEFWTSNTLTIRDEAGPPVDNEIEATNRADAISASSRSYVTFNNLQLLQTETDAVRHITVSVGVTWDNVFVDWMQVCAQLTAATAAVINNSVCTQQATAGGSGFAIDTAGLSGVTFNNRQHYNVLAGSAINQTNSNASTVVADNNGMTDAYNVGGQWSVTGASTLNILNGVSPGTSYGTADYPIKPTSGSATVDYSDILPDGQNGAKEPVNTSNVTEGAHNIYAYPGWTAPRESGVVGFVTDDEPDLCEWAIGSNFAAPYGIHSTLSYSQTYLLNTTAALIYNTTPTDTTSTTCYGSPYLSVLASGSGSTTNQAIVQTQINNGNDVVSHTRSHPSLATLTSGACASTLCLMDVHYIGAGSTATMTISGCAGSGPCTLTTTTSVGGAENLNLDLTTSSSYYSAQLLCAAIQAAAGGSKFTCTQATASHESYSIRVPSVMLAAVSAQDIKTAAYSLLLSQTPFFSNEITSSMADLNGAFNCTSAPHVGACSTGTFGVNALNYPDGNNSSTVQNTVQAAGYKGARGVNAVGWTFPQNMFVGASANIAEYGTVYTIGFEITCNDQSVNANNFTCSNVTNSTTQWYRTSHSGQFNGTTSFAFHSAATAVSDFHRGDFVISAELYPTTLNSTNTIYFQRTDDNNYIWLYVNASGKAIFSIFSASSEIVHLESANGAIATGSGTGATATWQELSVVAHTNNYRMFVNFAQVAWLNSTAKPATFTGNVQLGATNFGGTAGDFYTGYMDDVAVGREGYMATTSQLSTLASNGGFILYTNHGESDAPRPVVQSVYEAVKDYLSGGGNVRVMTQSQALNYIYSVGTLGADNLTITWVQPDQHNYRPRLGSPLCGAGTTPGITTDADGLPWLRNDIGPYRCVPKTAFGGVF